MTNIEILIKCDVMDPLFALALRSAEADELEEALLLSEDKQKLGRIRAALRRLRARSHGSVRTDVRTGGDLHGG